jgi:hypothetical protein
MKVLDIITETQIDPRILSDDQIMATLREGFRRDPNAMRSAFTEAEHAQLSFFARRRANAAAVEAAFATRWGPQITKFFVVAQIAGPIYMWYGKMQALNELAKEKGEDGQYKYSDDYLIRARNGITGIAIISIIAVPLMKGAINATLGTLLKEIFKALLRNVGGKAGGAAIVIAAVASSAAWLGLTLWLQTPAGEAWLRSFIPELIINGIGWAGNWGIDKATDFIKQKTGVDISADPDTKKRIADTPPLDMDWDPAKERAKIRAGGKVDVPDFKTDMDYSHTQQNY